MQHIRVSQLDTELLDTWDSNLVVDSVFESNDDVDSESVDSSRGSFDGNFRKGGFNDWKRFRGVKRVKKDS